MRQPTLQLENGVGCLRPFTTPIRRRLQVLGPVRFVKDQHAVKEASVVGIVHFGRCGDPSDELIEPRLAVLVLGDQGLVSAKHDAIIWRRLAVAQLVERMQRHLRTAQVVQVTPRVMEQSRRHGAPYMTMAAVAEIVEDDGRNLPALSDARAVA